VGSLWGHFVTKRPECPTSADGKQSFDTAVDFLGAYVEPADILDASGSLAFDASTAGIAPGANLDALSEASDGDGLIVSFDTGGEVAGIVYADEDLLRVRTSPSYSWAMEVDASAVDLAWERADIDALHYVPEPAQRLQLLVRNAGPDRARAPSQGPLIRFTNRQAGTTAKTKAGDSPTCAGSHRLRPSRRQPGGSPTGRGRFRLRSSASPGSSRSFP